MAEGAKKFLHSLESMIFLVDRSYREFYFELWQHLGATAIVKAPNREL